MKNADKINHKFWAVSENLKATADVLSDFNAQLLTYLDDESYSKTKALDIIALAGDLLPNVESLIEAAKEIQDTARPVTVEILTYSIALKQNTLNCIRELQSRCVDYIETGIRADRPEYAYRRVIKQIKAITGKARTTFGDLISKVEAESMLKRAETSKPEKPKKEKQKIEYSFPLKRNQWADIFGCSEHLIRKWEKEETYHFSKVKNSRRWTLPMGELPAEYLAEYRKLISKRTQNKE